MPNPSIMLIRSELSFVEIKNYDKEIDEYIKQIVIISSKESKYGIKECLTSMFKSQIKFDWITLIFWDYEDAKLFVDKILLEFKRLQKVTASVEYTFKLKYNEIVGLSEYLQNNLQHMIISADNIEKLILQHLNNTVLSSQKADTSFVQCGKTEGSKCVFCIKDCQNRIM